MKEPCRPIDIELFLTKLLREPLNPEHDFISHGETRADVYARAAQLYASFTERAGDNAGHPVCLAAEERSVVAAALLAALASGTVLLLPHSFSKQALLQMQETTGFTAAVVDVERELPQGTELLSCKLPCDMPHFPSDQRVLFQGSSINPDTELLRIFTGGSTGTPKIWSKTAGNIFGEALYMASRYQISDRDRIVSTVSPYHIYGLLFSVVIPLVTSAAVLAEAPFFPAEIVACVTEQEATLLVSVPAHYRVVKDRTVGTSLRLAFSSAGMLPKEDGLAFSAANTIGVVEVYGSTETGGLATRDRSTGQEFFSPLAPVGYQIRDQRLYVQSPFLSPDLALNEDGYFLSGDRVKKEGSAEFSLHGRADAITKVAGIRVDLDEVLDLLQSQPGVKECVVLPLDDTGGRSNRIVALVRGADADINQIKTTMSEVLETAALPKRIMVVSVIPVTPSGKYDREAICRLFASNNTTTRISA